MGLLHNGITGFDNAGEVPASQLKRAVYAAAQATGAKVGDTKLADGVTPNFHEVNVECGSQAFAVLCNRHLPVVAFAERIDDMEIDRFADAPADFAAAFAECGFVIGDAAELNRRVTSADLEMLSPAERRQAKYWKPERVGDIIFNWWD
jgi:hypothetical protein